MTTEIETKKTKTPHNIIINDDPAIVYENICNAIIQYNEENVNFPLAVIYGGTVCYIKIVEDSITISPLSYDGFRERLNRIADFVREFKDGSTRKELPPLEYLRMIINAEDPPFPVLSSIYSHPFYNSDGQLVTENGYDPTHKTFLHQRVSVKIDHTMELQEAIANADDLFFNFPFAGNADYENLLALPLWLITKDLIGGRSPMWGIESNSAGTGKDLATHTAVTPITGANIPTTGEIKNPDEMRKTLLATVADGTEILLFDNINGILDSGELAGFVTAEEYSGRWLGKTKTVSYKNNTTIGWNANNVEMSLEIARRNIWCKLMTQVSRPWEIDVNNFRHPDLREYTRVNRDKIFSSYVCMVQNWIDKGMPKWSGKPLGSFESFSRGIGGILECAGYTHFMDNRLAIFDEADSESMILGQFLSVWWEKFSNSPVTVSMLFPIAQDIDGLDIGEGSTRGQKITLGRRIMKRRDTILDGLRIRSAGKKSRIAQWYLEKVEEENIQEAQKTNSNNDETQEDIW